MYIIISYYSTQLVILRGRGAGWLFLKLLRPLNADETFIQSDGNIEMLKSWQNCSHYKDPAFYQVTYNSRPKWPKTNISPRILWVNQKSPDTHFYIFFTGLTLPGLGYLRFHRTGGGQSDPRTIYPIWDEIWSYYLVRVSSRLIQITFNQFIIISLFKSKLVTW